MLKIGSHVSMGSPDYLLKSVKESLDYKANTFMFYTGAPQNSIRTPLEKLNIEQFRNQLKVNNIDINDIIIHAPYLINLANNTDPIKFENSLKMLESEVFRTLSIGCRFLVLHPGATTGLDINVAINNIANSLNQIITKYPNIIILLETMSGKGSEVGRNFEEIAQIIEKIERKESVGVCLDTCHIFDGGYDLSDSNNILETFDKIIGLQYIYVVHVNDSKNIQGSHKDRHANIGYGNIGFDNIINFIYNTKLDGKVFILETPWVKYENNLIFPPYKFEIEMIRNKKFNPTLFDDIYNEYKK